MSQAEAVALEAQTDALARAAQGDPEAFDALVERHQRLVFSLVWHFSMTTMLALQIASSQLKRVRPVFVEETDHAQEAPLTNERKSE